MYLFIAGGSSVGPSHWKPFALFLVLIVVGFSTSAVCEPTSTVFVTLRETVTSSVLVTASASTSELVNAAAIGSEFPSSISNGSTISTSFTTVVTSEPNIASQLIASGASSSISSVQSIPSIQDASSSSSGIGYYYIEVNGTTSWFGGNTPTVTGFIITRTATFLVTPVPSTQDESLSSTLTVYKTNSTTTRDETVIIISSSSTIETLAAGSFTGVGPGGWNGSSSVAVGYGSTGLGTQGTVGLAPTAVRMPVNGPTAVHPSGTGSTPTATYCGQAGDTGPFTITFDDLPIFSPANNATADFPPIYNPYHHLFFSGGFAFAPPPNDPFPPTSPPHLGIFVTDSNVTVPDVTIVPTTYDGSWGELGAGPRFADSTYWIDAHSVNMGCDNSGLGDCKIIFYGYTYDAKDGGEVLHAEQITSLPPCPGFKDCTLTPVILNDSFTGLSGLRIRAVAGEIPRIFFLDDFQLSWTNSSCAAGVKRGSGR
ncbi:MAG: hypothetical protein M1824_000224 [Vezdaea acicularis]|nr:MAG: hypothetical protein M1824_000224 [Vezdaea acicularis]